MSKPTRDQKRYRLALVVAHRLIGSPDPRNGGAKRTVRQAAEQAAKQLPAEQGRELVNESLVLY